MRSLILTASAEEFDAAGRAVASTGVGEIVPRKGFTPALADRGRTWMLDSRAKRLGVGVYDGEAGRAAPADPATLLLT
jgi:hypothetical protein